MAKDTSGNCYLCGTSLGKTAMKNHLLKVHGVYENGDECRLLKIEGGYDKEYWLFIDAPVKEKLGSVDEFLRRIWLECCGHLSQFCYDPWKDEISMDIKLGDLIDGEKIFHLYDFGTTTETILTVVGTTRRPPQKKAVRLLARNAPLVFECGKCGKEAKYIYNESYDMPFYCADCGDKLVEDESYLLPVTNSPRMGECAYSGEGDVFAFDPKAFG